MQQTVSQMLPEIGGLQTIVYGGFRILTKRSKCIFSKHYCYFECCPISLAFSDTAFCTE
ncbi:hypothetical protein B7P43_G11276 [Cryptotermes secundus]|uniref:Uncharacterized protein n=1 Tax=Cryptotermes secundus TaxID=105785 RepID=A0A2J7PZB7_9NEOP|nr:hypothetical protein B7P43_G11276 [Cryptotermes secundus]